MKIIKINEWLPKSLTEAKKNGCKHYFTGRYCKRFHLSMRMVNGGCMECARARAKKWISDNPERNQQKLDKWRKENKDYIAEYNKKHREEYSEHYKRYREENRHIFRKRHINKLQAQPLWADEEEIKYIYNLALEKDLSVDHIVPLQSKYVCGLHCADNLRCIPEILNRKKNNRYWPDMPEELRPRVLLT